MNRISSMSSKNGLTALRNSPKTAEAPLPGLLKIADACRGQSYPPGVGNPVRDVTNRTHDTKKTTERVAVGCDGRRGRRDDR